MAVRPFDVQFFQALLELEGGSRIHRVMQAVLRPGDWFIDIGANHGSYSLLASRLVGDSGRITAVEANPEVAACLRKSLQMNCEHNSSVLECALGNENGSTAFHFNPIGSGSGSLHSAQAERGSMATQVKMSRFDDAIPWRETSAERILVKCDVEGAEYSVFCGAESFLRSRRPTLVFECNPAGSSAAGASVGEVLRLLSDIGYTQFCDSRDFPQRTPRERLDVERMGDFVALGSGCEGL
jgi:FkbM family methyltransferase